MKRLKDILLILLVPAMAVSFHVPNGTYTYEFAVKIFPNGSSLITTAIVTVSEGKVIRSEVLSETQFLLEVSGTVQSKANPKPTDLFFKNGIYACSRDKDTIRYRYKVMDSTEWKDRAHKNTYLLQEGKVKCEILANLWKVRYRYDIRKKNYNFNTPQKAEGWSQDRFWPNLKQSNYIRERYGSDGINEFIYGDKLYLLLKDVQDTAWIENYKNLK